MMQAINRSEIFKQSVFVDNQIAFEQQATYRSINCDDPDEMAYMMPFLDHLEAFDPQLKPLDGFCVLAYAADTREDYQNNFSLAIVDFFTRLKIEKLYLLSQCKIDWNEYGFENQEKKSRFLKTLDGKENAVGLLLSVKELPDVLPLFFYRHPDHPHINLIPPVSDIPVDMFLCKDGNLHTLFDERNHGQLKTTAAASGLYMGSYEVCQLYRNSQLE
jgi:hypothetical protein